jgi:hypothetical protein
MGLVRVGRTGEILELCKPKIKEYKKKLDIHPILPEGDIIFLLILLSQYLYAKYYKYGTPNGDDYDVYPNTIYKALKDTGLGSFAKNVIELRNSVCHEYGTDKTTAELLQLVDNINKLKDLVDFVVRTYKEDEKPNKPVVLIVGQGKNKSKISPQQFIDVMMGK